MYTRWNQKLTPRDRELIARDLSLGLLAAVASPSLRGSLVSLVENGKFADLSSFPVDYVNWDTDTCRIIRQVQALYSKRVDWDSGIDKEAAAVRTFTESESLCAETNRLIRLRRAGAFQFSARVEHVVRRAQQKILTVLGDVPAYSDLRFRFGPGSTTSIPKRMASPRAKLGDMPYCSSELFPHMVPILREMPVWRDHLVERLGAIPALSLVTGGKIQFVPKSFKTHRSISVEPSLNVMFQLGVGGYIEKRLRGVGVDVKNQATNRDLARFASVTGCLATVDLSSASDTIALELVYELLGIEWASFLRRGRTSNVELNGRPITLEKFSTMGNGFTFPLETLIFYALTWACCDESNAGFVNAYGDDIIIPVSSYDLLCDVLMALGFKVNTEKSFATGPFRESCGADFHYGTDIRPCYLRNKEGLTDVCAIFRLHNHFYRCFNAEACRYLRSYLHPSIRLYGPDGYGDGHLLGRWTPRRSRRMAESGYGGYIFDSFVKRPLWSATPHKGDAVLPVYTSYISTDSETPSIRYRGTEEGFWVSIPGSQGYDRISIYTFVT